MAGGFSLDGRLSGQSSQPGSPCGPGDSELTWAPTGWWLRRAAVQGQEHEAQGCAELLPKEAPRPRPGPAFPGPQPSRPTGSRHWGAQPAPLHIKSPPLLAAPASAGVHGAPGQRGLRPAVCRGVESRGQRRGACRVPQGLTSYTTFRKKNLLLKIRK